MSAVLDSLRDFLELQGGGQVSCLGVTPSLCGSEGASPLPTSAVCPACDRATPGPSVGLTALPVQRVGPLTRGWKLAK